MADIAGLPYAEAEFDRDGALAPAAQEAAVLAAIAAAAPTDLVVIAHGWNNDMADARALYAGIFARVAAVRPSTSLPADRRIAVLGLLWPSKKFTERELIPGGGAAGLGASPDDMGDVATGFLEREIDALKEIAAPGAPDLEEAKGLIDRLENDPEARRRFVALVRDSLDPPTPGETGPEVGRDALTGDGDALLEQLRAPFMDLPAASGLGGAAGLGDAAPMGAAGLGDAAPMGAAAGIGAPFASAKAAAERLLNLATYYQMKERAGRVGGTGAAALLRAVRRRFPDLRIHLVGHSFGARLVTVAADACGTEVAPASMLLLQAAFSHNAFSPSFTLNGRAFSGNFRRVLQERKVAGPIVITHTANDKAVGLAYAVASRLAGQAASSLGDEHDPFGGLGRNGAVNMPAGELGAGPRELLAPGGAYAFAPGRVCNLRADRFIDGHSGIRNDAVAYALLSALA